MKVLFTPDLFKYEEEFVLEGESLEAVIEKLQEECPVNCFFAVKENDMRSVVFECRKCGHNLYFETKEDAVKKMVKISNLDCPRCGEEPEGNWILVGVCENPYYPVKEKE